VEEEFILSLLQSLFFILYLLVKKWMEFFGITVKAEYTFFIDVIFSIAKNIFGL